MFVCYILKKHIFRVMVGEEEQAGKTLPTILDSERQKPH